MHTLREFGVTHYLIQEREVDQTKIRTAFTMTLGLSWLFAAILFAISGLAADFYQEPGVEQVVWVMALNFLVIPFGSPILALLRREMQFGRLSAIQLASNVVNAGVAITLALLGHGFMSLAWASLATVITTSLLALSSRPRTFLLRPSLKEWRSIAGFGAYACINALATDLRQTSPDLVMGRLLGFEAVGLYSRAVGLLAIFNKVILEALYPVMLPALAEKARRGEDLRDAFLRSYEYMAVLYWPFLTFLAFLAEPVIMVLLGDQWLAAAPIIRILCIAYAIGSPGYMAQTLLIAMGRMRDLLVLNLLVLPPMITALVIGSMFSLETVAWLLVVAHSISITITMRFVEKLLRVRVSDVLLTSGKSLLVAALTSAVPLFTALWPEMMPQSSLLLLLVVGPLTAAVWLAAVVAARHSIAGEMNFVLGKVRHALGRN